MCVRGGGGFDKVGSFRITTPPKHREQGALTPSSSSIYKEQTIRMSLSIDMADMSRLRTEN